MPTLFKVFGFPLVVFIVEFYCNKTFDLRLRVLIASWCMLQCQTIPNKIIKMAAPLTTKWPFQERLCNNPPHEHGTP